MNLEPAVQRLADLVSRVEDHVLGMPTPCSSYTLGDLIEHIGGLALAFTAAASKDGGKYADQAPSGDASRLGDDWRTRIPHDLAALAQAWREPGATARTAARGGRRARWRRRARLTSGPSGPSGPSAPARQAVGLPAGSGRRRRWCDSRTRCCRTAGTDSWTGRHGRRCSWPRRTAAAAPAARSG